MEVDALCLVQKCCNTRLYFNGNCQSQSNKTDGQKHAVTHTISL